MTPAEAQNQFLIQRTNAMAERLKALETENSRQKKHIKVLSAINAFHELIEKLKQHPAIYQTGC